MDTDLVVRARRGDKEAHALLAAGPTADDLAAALAAIPGVEATSSDVEVGGYPARFVSLDVPDTFGDCVEDSGEALLSGGANSGPLEPGVHRFWIVEVGEDRIVIGGGSTGRVAATGERDRHHRRIGPHRGAVAVPTGRRGLPAAGIGPWHHGAP